MLKLVLFTDDKQWSVPQGGNNIRRAFEPDVPDFSEGNPVMLIGQNGRREKPESASIAIVWEPTIESTTYGNSVVLESIKRTLDVFSMGGADAALGAAYHIGSKDALKAEQKNLLGSLGVVCHHRNYHHAEEPPYNLFSKAIAAAGGGKFEDRLGELMRWFQPPEVPAYEILLPGMILYLKGELTPAQMPFAQENSDHDESWVRLGAIVLPPEQRNVNRHAAKGLIRDAMIAWREKEKFRDLDDYSLFCKVMTKFISKDGNVAGDDD